MRKSLGRVPEKQYRVIRVYIYIYRVYIYLPNQTALNVFLGPSGGGRLPKDHIFVLKISEPNSLGGKCRINSDLSSRFAEKIHHPQFVV